MNLIIEAVLKNYRIVFHNDNNISSQNFVYLNTLTPASIYFMIQPIKWFDFLIEIYLTHRKGTVRLAVNGHH